MKLVIAADGEWDIASAAQWTARISAEIDRAGTSGDVVVLDMSGVSFMGSSGLSVLSQARTRCLMRGVRLVLRGPSPQLMRLLMVTGMSQILEIEPFAQREV